MVEFRDGWPLKTREFQNHHFDSRVWNGFEFRDDDIVIATYAKSGTTWMQQIVGQLVFRGAPDVPIHELSPWLDMRIRQPENLAALAAQTHRRFIKTHLPVDALVVSPRAKYLYIGRDGRDVAVSLYNHHAQANEHWYRMLNDTPGRVGPPIPPPAPDARTAFRTWLDEDGEPFWPFWSSVRWWWAIRHLPNVLFVHFADLKREREAEMRRIAAFLGIELDAGEWAAALEHTSFEYMRAHGEYAVPGGGQPVAGRGALVPAPRRGRPLARTAQRGGLGCLRGARARGARAGVCAVAGGRGAGERRFMKLHAAAR